MDQRSLQPLWKRGPSAFELAMRSDYVLDELRAHPKPFISVRKCCSILGVSHHTLKDWVKRKLIPRSKISRKFRTKDLIAFVEGVASRPKEPPQRESRFGKVPRRFDMIRSAQIDWPKEETHLTPRELARRLGCHPSTLTKAFKARRLPGERKTRGRWHIPRTRWVEWFHWTIRFSK
jgi:predicted DNA-binding transcriptional regulator AlpA